MLVHISSKDEISVLYDEVRVNVITFDKFKNDYYGLTFEAI